MAKYDAELFEQVPLIGIMRNYSASVVQRIGAHFFSAGFNTLEVTLNAADALQSIRLLSSAFPSMNIGAGTVCTIAELNLAHESGASFAVSPICDIALIKAAIKMEMAIFPGALTPTEIYSAWQAGATAVKLFPAGGFGEQYLKEIQGPLPNIKVIPVGGINLNNMTRYFEQGAYGVGLGGGLFKRKEILGGEDEKIKAHFNSVYRQLKMSTADIIRPDSN